jgi:hypothetical protein
LVVVDGRLSYDRISSSQCLAFAKKVLSFHLDLPASSDLVVKRGKEKGGASSNCRPDGSGLSNTRVRSFALLQDSLPEKFSHDYVKFIDSAMPVWLELLEAREATGKPLKKANLRHFNDHIWAGRLTPAGELIEPICTTIFSLEDHAAIKNLQVRPQTRQ